MNFINFGFSFLKKSLIIVLITFFFSLIIDFFFGRLILKGLDSYLVKTEFYGRLMRIDHPVFHHSFLPNVNYKKNSGFDGKFTLCTNRHSFRSNCKEDIKKNIDIAFMGDSFVEGHSVNYEDSFVGIFDDKTNFSVANLGVSSYSPKIYFTKLNYLISQNYYFKHIIFFIDISDLYDDDVRYKLNDDNSIGEKDLKGEGLKRRKILRTYFPLTNYYMYVIKKNRQIKRKKPTLKSETPNLESINFKAEWTYYEEENHPAYLNNITTAQNEMIKTMEKTFNLLKQNNIKMSLAVYPWPQQLQFDKVNSKHVKMWKKFCENKCENFINFFPVFFKEKEKSSFLEVYKKYYFWNDVHFNKTGNQLIANKLLDIFN